ncbi:energy transducer TonB [Pontibacter liquoris]|uniref:energy transducer TonB n=1 Tax=Pontibacter liquoris TaxID=2905677 RepID=UPI001FA7CC6C|nr:energy transducer TonB [Pontibacter liquoris]
MEKSYLFSTTFNNVVFKGRNKAYGAYELRMKYGRNLTLAAILATATFSGALVAPLLQEKLFGKAVPYEKPVYDIYEPFVLELPPAPPAAKPKEAAQPVAQPKAPVKTKAYATTKVIPDNAPDPVKQLATQDDLKNANIGTADIEGIAPEVPSITLPDAPPAELGTTAPAKPDEPYVSVEKMPEFAGGEKALFKFLSQNITYPVRARQANVEGLVIVTFVVAVTGEIQDVTVLKGLGYGTEEEAVRVIRKMPSWSPGRQNGRAVPVRYTLPIRFNMQ